VRALALAVERSIGPEASRTHIPFTFALERPVTSMQIDFSYAPKVLADGARARELAEAGARRYGYSPDHPRRRLQLTNFLTLSLDGPSGFRGCAHRHPPRQRITLDGAAATPGFIAGPLEAGSWTATISVHSVVTDRCRFLLRVRVR
jgi:hypothetical protein